ncbi:MAG TPA: hypothetical protein VGV59_10005 [Pyrinomonadaceae bacterium]|nr:hypothetical protein [Pyrinomonadaceae bacterium]
MSSRRQQIVEAVKTRFATIRTAHGYQTEVGANVREWYLETLDEEELPALLISDGIEDTIVPEQGKNSGTYTRHLEITAIVVLAVAAANAANARAALADVIACIGKDDKWGGLARRTLPVSDELGVDKESERIGGVRVTFVVEYSRPPWEA